MSNFVKRLLAALALIIILVTAGIIYTYPRWWYRIGSAEAMSPSGHVHEVAIYKSTSGDVLFIITEDSLIDEYVFYPSTGSIGIPNGIEFKLYFSPVLVYGKETPVPTVLATNRIKIDEDFNFVVDAKHLEFTTLHRLRLKADRINF